MTDYLLPDNVQKAAKALFGERPVLDIDVYHLIPLENFSYSATLQTALEKSGVRCTVTQMGSSSRALISISECEINKLLKRKHDGDNFGLTEKSETVLPTLRKILNIYINSVDVLTEIPIVSDSSENISKDIQVLNDTFRPKIELVSGASKVRVSHFGYKNLCACGLLEVIEAPPNVTRLVPKAKSPAQPTVNFTAFARGKDRQEPPDSHISPQGDMIGKPPIHFIPDSGLRELLNPSAESKEEPLPPGVANLKNARERKALKEKGKPPTR